MMAVASITSTSSVGMDRVIRESGFFRVIVIEHFDLWEMVLELFGTFRPFHQLFIYLLIVMSRILLAVVVIVLMALVWLQMLFTARISFI